MSAENDRRANDTEIAAGVLAAYLTDPPHFLIVAGSGLGGISEGIKGGVEIPFERFPGYPSTGVIGHAGSYLAGRLGTASVLIQRGRYHLYEGHPRETVTLPIRVAAQLGIRVAILTNAAGGIRTDLSPGTIVLLDTCLDFLGGDLLRDGSPPSAGPGRRSILPPALLPLDPDLLEVAWRAARERGIPLARGKYAGVLGPSFETPAEIRMLAAFGGDVVGMSTVPEVIAAKEEGLSVLALSLVTNRAAGVEGGAPNHEEVLRVGRGSSGEMVRLIRGIVESLSDMV